MAGQTELVPPVFLASRSLPAADEKEYTTLELCTAAEKVTGYGKVIGSQRIGSLWRVYTTDITARMELLTRGLVLRGYVVTVKDKNPFLRTEGNGEEREIPTTRLTIGNIPMSHPNDDILQFLQTMQGFKPCSRMMDERVMRQQWQTHSLEDWSKAGLHRNPSHPPPQNCENGTVFGFPISQGTEIEDVFQLPGNDASRQCVQRAREV